MTRRFRVPAIALTLFAIALVAMLPPRTQHTAAPPATTVRGAFHIHSNRSDGSGTIAEIAAAAAAAGLHFIILTDHGDGTRAPDPPTYHSGVLVIDGAEISTTGGHYATFGLPASPYPLAGTPHDVIEDVHRLGGFGFAAHPGSPRPSLSWQDWSAPIDGLEWINSDSEWRDEARLPLARALATYLFRAPQSMATLLDRPAAVMARWDELAATRPVVGIAAADAHARLGFRQRTDPDVSKLHLPLPGYESSFRAFTNHVVLDRPLNKDAASDAGDVLSAIRAGRLYSVIDALATPGALSFSASNGAATARMGDTLAPTGNIVLRATASAPPGTALVLFKNGQRIHEVVDRPLEANGGSDAAVYRIEAYVPGVPSVPWLVSNPIYATVAKPRSIAPLPPPSSRIPVRTAEAATESGPNDISRIEVGAIETSESRTFAGDPAIRWSYALAPGLPTGQFAAVPIPVSPGLEAFERVQFRVTSPQPLRAWVQLRAAVGNTERWGATFYADSNPRLVDIPFTKFLPIGVTSSAAPPLNRVEFLLFVVDTLNTLPGSKGSMTITEVGFVR